MPMYCVHNHVSLQDTDSALKVPGSMVNIFEEQARALGIKAVDRWLVGQSRDNSLVLSSIVLYLLHV